MQRAKIVLAAAFLILAFFSSYKLSEAPGIWYDEGYFTQMAMNMADQGKEVIQIAPDTFISSATQTGGFPLIFPVAASYKLFGVGVAQGRYAMVMYLFLFLIAAYWYARLLFGAEIAAWSALLLSTFAMLYGNGKSVLGEVPGLFYFLLTLIALVYLERNDYRNLRSYALVGLCAGLCVVTKPIFILLAPALFAVWLLRWKRIPIRWVGFMLALVSFSVPVAVWIHFQFGQGDSISSMLAFYANPYDVQNLSALAWQNVIRFFTESTPIYTLGLLLMWGTSLIVRKCSKEDIMSAELAAFSFCLIVLLAYLRLPGWYRYIFPAATIALIFLPFALHRTYSFLRGRFPVLEKRTWVPTALLITLALFQLYQLSASSYVADYYEGHRTRDLAAALSALPSGASFFLYNVPEVAVVLPSKKYYQYLKPHETDEAEVYGRDQLPLLVKGNVDYVIVGHTFYDQHLETFSRYTLVQHANRYAILKRI